MIINIMSASEARFYSTGKKSAIIRIADSHDQFADIGGLYDHGLYLTFYDVEPRSGLPSNWNWFNKNDGQDVKDFLDTIVEDEVEELVIHCHAGVSRSPAIGIAVGWYLQDESIVNNILNMPVAPNIHVLNIMSHTLGIAREKRQFINNMSQSRKEVKEDKKWLDLF